MCEQIGWRGCQRSRKPKDIDQCEVPLPSLDSADITSGKSALQRQTLLRPTFLAPQFCDPPAKPV